jgi:hypothetical protein
MSTQIGLLPEWTSVKGFRDKESTGPVLALGSLLILVHSEFVVRRRIERDPGKY